MPANQSDLDLQADVAVLGLLVEQIYEVRFSQLNGDPVARLDGMARDLSAQLSDYRWHGLSTDQQAHMYDTMALALERRMASLRARISTRQGQERPPA